MDRQTIQNLVAHVRAAQDQRYQIDKITVTHCPTLSTAQAYLVQQELIRQRLAEGDAIAGPKMGFTSLAKLKQMNATDPIYGYVFQSMVVPDNSAIHLKDYIHPKAEPEIGFVLKYDFQGPGITKEDVMRAVDFLFPAIEIIDSRYKNYNFTLPDVIADNTSAAGAVFGTRVKPNTEMDLAAIEVTMQINGEAVAHGNGAAVLDHPAHSVARLANMLAEKGEAVKAGQPILTGGVTAAVALSKGDKVDVMFNQGLGSAHLLVDA